MLMPLAVAVALYGSNALNPSAAEHIHQRRDTGCHQPSTMTALHRTAAWDEHEYRHSFGVQTFIVFPIRSLKCRAGRRTARPERKAG
jgi:hypothetical protein